jgi:hypothetical protein
MAGVSQTTPTVSASAAWLSASLPSICTLPLGLAHMGGADLHRAAGRFEASHDRPWPGAMAIDLAEPRPAQAAARREKRDRFQQIGLAGAVRAGQHDRPRIGFEPQTGIAAKVGERDPAHGEPRRRPRPAVQRERHQTRIGIST